MGSRGVNPKEFNFSCVQSNFQAPYYKNSNCKWKTGTLFAHLCGLTTK